MRNGANSRFFFSFASSYQCSCLSIHVGDTVTRERLRGSSVCHHSFWWGAPRRSSASGYFAPAHLPRKGDFNIDTVTSQPLDMTLTSKYWFKIVLYQIICDYKCFFMTPVWNFVIYTVIKTHLATVIISHGLYFWVKFQHCEGGSSEILYWSSGNRINHRFLAFRSKLPQFTCVLKCFHMFWIVLKKRLSATTWLGCCCRCYKDFIAGCYEEPYCTHVHLEAQETHDCEEM